MSHDKRALQKQAQETFIYLAGNIRLGVKMSSSTTAQKKAPEQQTYDLINKSEYLLALLKLKEEKEKAKVDIEKVKDLTNDVKKLFALMKVKEGRLGDVPTRNEVV